MRRLALAVAAALLATSACSGPTSPKVSVPPVKVDTPALRTQKAAAGIVTCPSAAPASASAAHTLPDLTLPCLGGGPSVDLDRLKGPLLVNVWFANCYECRQEMPHLAAFYRAYHDRVPLLGVDIEPYDPSSDLALLDDLGATYPQVADGDNAIERQRSLYLQQGAPHTIFYAADGTTWVHSGPITSVAQLKTLVAQHLGVRL